MVAGFGEITKACSLYSVKETAGKANQDGESFKSRNLSTILVYCSELWGLRSDGRGTRSFQVCRHLM